MNVDELRQAVTDALAVLALVQAKTTNHKAVHALLVRYSDALRSEDGHEYGAALVSELARVVSKGR